MTMPVEQKPAVNVPAAQTISGNRQNRELLWTSLSIAFVLALVWICFARTLTSYFLADDFGEVFYVRRILLGDWAALWANFTGNYMQIPGMAVYRPVLLLTLLWDCALWKGNAIGYYLTNLLYFSADAVLVYIVSRQLSRSWPKLQSRIAALCAAGLFAVNPLHCESISWVVGRVDTACCFFYLCALALILHSRSRKSNFAGIASIPFFWLGLLTKEMAIGLPLLVTVIGLTERAASLRERIGNAFAASKGLWASTVVYFAIRLAALGTLFGGYSGAIGSSQSSVALTRWLDGDTYHRLFFPLVSSVFGQNHFYGQIMSSVYLSCLILLIVRCCLKSAPPLSLVLVLIGWTVSAALPIYRLWGLGFDLEGARFCFFLTVPLSMALPLLLLAPTTVQTAPSSNADSAGEDVHPEFRLMPLAVLLMVILGTVLFKAVCATNVLWIHAGKEVRRVCSETQKLLSEDPDQKCVPILGIPKEHCGAHMILNGDTFRTALAPPFQNQDKTDRLRLFDPIFFGGDQRINCSRFMAALSESGECAYIWSRKQQQYEKLTYAKPNWEKQPVDIPLSKAKTTDDGLLISGLNINPLQYGILAVRAQAPQSDPRLPVPFTVSWSQANKGDSTESLNSASIRANLDSTKSTVVRVPLATYWRWYSRPAWTNLRFRLPGSANLSITSIQLLPEGTCRPSLQLPQGKPDNIGVLACNGKIAVTVDVSSVPNCTGAILQISKPSFFFDQIADEEQQQAVSKEIHVAETRQPVRLQPDYFVGAGYYQVRAIGVNAHNEPVGLPSDAVTLRVDLP